jgi:uncharacterized protein
VKTPGLSPIKTRLAHEIGAESAERFYCASAAVIQQALKQVMQDTPTPDIRVQAFWAVGELGASDIVPEKVIQHWKDFPYVAQGEGDLGERMQRVYETLITLYDGVILIGADCPLITVSLLNHAANQLAGAESSRALVGPADDGGFYLMACNSLLSGFDWQLPPYSTDKAGKVLTEQLLQSCSVEELVPLFDVDTFEDLKRLGYLLQQQEHDSPEWVSLAEIVASLTVIPQAISPEIPDIIVITKSFGT